MTDAGGADREALLDGVRTKLAPNLLAELKGFRDALISHHANDLGFEGPPGGQESKDGAAIVESKTIAPAVAAPSTAPSGSSTTKVSSKSSSSSKVVRASADLAIRAEDLWQLLTQAERIPMWTRSPAQVSRTALFWVSPVRRQLTTVGPRQFEAKEGAAFALFDGNVIGKTTLVEPPKRLEQSWRLSQWPSEHYATLTTTLTEGSDSTNLELSLTGVPLGEEDASEAGLERFYIRSFRSMGLGTIL